MGQQLRVAIAGVEPGAYAEVLDILLRAGHTISLSVETHSEMLRECQFTSADIIVAGVPLEGDAELAAIKVYSEQYHFPVVLVSSRRDESFIESAIASGVVAYLIQPVRGEELVVALISAFQHHREEMQLRSELANVSQALEDRKIIERAKGIVMKKRVLDEESALRYLQQLARSHRQKLVEIAKSIVLAEAAFSPEAVSTSR